MENIKKIPLIISIFMLTLSLLVGCDREPEVKEDPYYTLTIEIVGQGEVIGLKEGANKLDKMANIDLEANPSSGYRFCFWEGDILPMDKYEQNTRIHLTKDMTVTVYFTNLRVPHSFSTIQGAINESKDGDIILVSPGTYEEAISFERKEIILQSENPHNETIREGTIILWDQSDIPIIKISNGSPTLTGFTITGGEAGAIEVQTASPTISYNRIINNRRDEGSAINLLAAHDTVIEHNSFHQNTSSIRGAIFALVCDNMLINNNTFTDNEGLDGSCLYVHSSTGLKLEENIFENNKSQGKGGVIYLERCEVIIENKNRFKENEAGTGGGAIFFNESTGVISDNDFQSNVTLGGNGGGLLMNQSNPKIFDNRIFLNEAREGLGGGIFITSNSAPKDQSNNNWPRKNYGPHQEKANTYINNSHSGSANNGNHVFFEDQG